MVCIYCGNRTEVVNSRPQKRTNSVWRRRQCRSCHAIFTTEEHVGYEQSLGLEIDASHIVPFRRDHLLLSIWEACRHRPDSLDTASALTDTIMQKLVGARPSNGSITRATLVGTVEQTLAHFDEAAAVSYRAFHSARTD